MQRGQASAGPARPGSPPSAGRLPDQTLPTPAGSDGVLPGPPAQSVPGRPSGHRVGPPGASPAAGRPTGSASVGSASLGAAPTGPVPPGPASVGPASPGSASVG